MENQYPSPIDRIQSTFIDSLCIIIALFMMASLFDKLGSFPDHIRISAFIVFVVLAEPLCVAFACTPGNYIKKIRVRSVHDTNSRIGFFAAIGRFIFKSVLGIVSFLTIFGNDKRRAMHDMLSGSVVIKVN